MALYPALIDRIPASADAVRVYGEDQTTGNVRSAWAGDNFKNDVWNVKQVKTNWFADAEKNQTWLDSRDPFKFENTLPFKIDDPAWNFPRKLENKLKLGDADFADLPSAAAAAAAAAAPSPPPLPPSPGSPSGAERGGLSPRPLAAAEFESASRVVRRRGGGTLATPAPRIGAATPGTNASAAAVRSALQSAVPDVVQATPLSRRRSKSVGAPDDIEPDHRHVEVHTGRTKHLLSLGYSLDRIHTIQAAAERMREQRELSDARRAEVLPKVTKVKESKAAAREHQSLFKQVKREEAETLRQQKVKRQPPEESMAQFKARMLRLRRLEAGAQEKISTLEQARELIRSAALKAVQRVQMPSDEEIKEHMTRRGMSAKNWGGVKGSIVKTGKFPRWW